MGNHKTTLLQIDLIVILFLGAALLLTTAQSTSSDPDNQNDDGSNNDASGTVALLVLVVMCGVLFLGSFSLWINCCCDDTPRRFRHPIIAILDARSQRGHSFNSEGSVSASAARGIDKAEIDAFPTISYATAKKLGLVDSNGSVDCAVCLSEFEGEELLLLLPMCDHAFHPQCVGTWLADHRTCPVCRADLALISSGIKTRKRMDPDSNESNLAVYSSEDFEQVVLQLQCGLGANQVDSVSSGVTRTGEKAETLRSWNWRRLTVGDSKAGDLMTPIDGGNNKGHTLSIPSIETQKIKIDNNVKLKRSVSLEALPGHSSLQRPSGAEEARVGRSCWPTEWSDRRASTSSTARLRLDLLEVGETSKRLTRPPV